MISSAPPARCLVEIQESPGAAIEYLLQSKSNPAVHPAIRTAATFIAPFMRTPSNILRQGLEASAIGFTMPAAKQGGREGAQAMGRAAIGSVALMPLAYLAATGRLSGNGPTYPGERAALLEKGWQANSIKFGNTWVCFQLFQPLSVPAAAVANAFERFMEGDRTDRAAEEAVGQAVAGAAASLLDQSFLAGLEWPARRHLRSRAERTAVPVGLRTGACTRFWSPPQRDAGGRSRRAQTRRGASSKPRLRTRAKKRNGDPCGEPSATTKTSRLVTARADITTLQVAGGLARARQRDGRACDFRARHRTMGRYRRCTAYLCDLRAAVDREEPRTSRVRRRALHWACVRGICSR